MEQNFNQPKARHKMKKPRKARESLTEVERQILQNQGAIMMALEMLGAALLKQNTMYGLCFGGLEQAGRNTGKLMSEARNEN